jgi:hypothetical protein
MVTKIHTTPDTKNGNKTKTNIFDNTKLVDKTIIGEHYVL